MTVYLLHFEPAHRHARHYLGFTPDETADRRVREHLLGHQNSSPLVRAALAGGSLVTLAHVFEGAAADRNFERSLKNRRDTRSWCPACQLNRRPLPCP